MQRPPFFYSKTLLLLLVILSSSIMMSTIFYQYDKALVINFNLKRSQLWDLVWLGLTNSAGVIGYGTAIWLLVASFFIKNRAGKMKCYTVLLAGIISGLAVTSIKCSVQRIRPYHLFSTIHHLGPGGGWSYPSGHTADAFYLAIILALVYPRRKLLVGMVFLWAILVGISRVYLGVHYLSDVLGAVAVSGISALLADMLVRFFERRRFSRTAD